MADIDDIEQPRAAGLIPNEPDLEGLREAAAECTACPLYRNATQTVFGEGPDRAVIMFVGEQPGDYEDLAGHPFVGPAGKMLDRCIKEAGIDRRRSSATSASASLDTDRNSTAKSDQDSPRSGASGESMNGIPRSRAIRSQIHADSSVDESKASASMSPRSYGWCPAATMFFDSRSGSLSAATSRPSATIRP